MIETDPGLEAVPRLRPRVLESHAYVVKETGRGAGLELVVIDADRRSPGHGTVVHRLELPEAVRDVTSLSYHRSAAEPDRYLLLAAPSAHAVLVIDTKPDPSLPRLARVLAAGEFAEDAGAEPRAICCRGPGLSIFWVSRDHPAGAVSHLDADTYERRGGRNLGREPGECSYGFACHPGHSTAVTSAWGSAEMAAAGLRPDLLMSAAYGHSLHVWDVHEGLHEQEIRLGDQSTVLELCAAHDPVRSYGFAAVTTSLEDLSAAIWMWHRNDSRPEDSRWQARKVIELPAEPAPHGGLPPVLASFAAVPPMVTHLELTTDDRYLFVSCWGTGEIRRYDVSNPFEPTLTDRVRIGGVLCETPHPAKPAQVLGGGPGRSVTNNDGSRVYLSSSLSAPWDEQFYPRGADHWLARVEVDPDGTMRVDETFFPDLEGQRALAVCLVQ